MGCLSVELTLVCFIACYQERVSVNVYLFMYTLVHLFTYHVFFLSTFYVLSRCLILTVEALRKDV